MLTLRARAERILLSRWFLIAAVAVGFLVRAAWSVAAGDAIRFYDSDSYIKIADNLLAGNGLLWGDERVGRPPLYPLLVAATRLAIFGKEFLLLYAVQTVLSTASILLFAAGARRLLGRVAEGVTAVIIALDPYLVFHAGTVLSETLFIFFVAAFFYSFTVALGRPRILAGVGAGAAAAAAHLTRPSVPGLVILFAVFLVVWAKPRRRAVLAALAIALTAGILILPWGFRNYRVTGHWIFTTLGVGASLYDGVGPQADGSSNMEFLTKMPELKGMTEVERDSYLLNRALNDAMESPGRVLALVPVKAYRFWSPQPTSGMFGTPFYRWVSLLAVVPVYALAALAVFTLSMRWRDLVILLAGPVYFTLVHVVFVGSPRYRSPIMPMVAMLAAAGVSRLLSARARAAAATETATAAGEAAPAGKPARRKKRFTLPFKIFLVLVFLFSLAAALSYAFYERWVANPSNVRDLAVAKISLFFPGKLVKVRYAEFSLLGGIDLYGAEVYEPAGDIPIAKVENVHIDFDRRRLWRFELVPKNVTAVDLSLLLVRGEDGRWNLSMPASSGGSAKPRLATPFTMSLKGAFVSVDDRRDNYAVSSTVNSVIVSSDADSLARWRLMASFGGGLLGTWRLAASGNSDARTLAVQFTVDAIELGEGLSSRLPPPARRVWGFFTPSGPADITGRVSYSPAEKWDFDVTAALKGIGETYDRFPVRVSGLVGWVRFNRDGCSFADLAGTSLGGSVRISGRTEGYGPGAAYHVAIDARGLALVDELFAAFPPKARAGIELFSPRGAIDAVTKIDRERGAGKPLVVACEVYPKGIRAVYRGFPLALDGITGHFTYNNGDISVDVIRGVRGSSEVTITGSALALARSADIDMVVEAKGLALDDELRDLLPPESQAAWKTFSVAGKADVRTRVRKRPREQPYFDITADMRGVDILYAGLPYGLTGGEGAVVIQDGAIYFDNARFMHGGARLAATGEADMYSGTVDLDLEAKDLPMDAEFMSALPEEARRPLERYGVSGIADAKMAVSRPAGGKISVFGVEGSLRAASFIIPEVPLGVAARKLSLVYGADGFDVSGLEGSLFADNSLVMMPFVRMPMLARPATEVAAAGRADLSGRQGSAWQLRFDAGRLFADDALLERLPEKVRAMAADRQMRGFVDAAGDLSYGETDGAGAVDFDLAIKCRDASVVLAKSIKDILGDVSLKGRGGAADVDLVANGRLLSGAFDSMRVGPTQFDLEKDADSVRVNRLETDVLKGKLSGQGFFKTGGAESYAFSILINDVSLPDLVDKAFAFRKEGLTGTIDGRMDLLCATGKSCDVIATAEANIHDGTLWEVPVIFAMMNVLQLRIPERTQFDRAHVRCDIAENRLLIRELSMSSVPATLFGEGTIGFDGKLDLMFYARPGQIPLVSLIAGEVGRNLVKAHITGTFSDPQVTLVPSGPFGKFLNWIKTRVGRMGK